MKIFLAIMSALAILIPANFGLAANVNPSCTLLKFTDDTRFDSLETAANLSKLVWEKISASNRFNLYGAEPLDVDIEARLYDEKVDALTNFDAAISSGDYNNFFEGDGFSERKAQSVATAQVGQIVTPEITAEIGAIDNAEYLIQGTIINIGTGAWLNEDLEILANVASSAAAAAGSQVANLIGGSGAFLSAISMKTRGIGVQCDVRIIRAETGEVVWSKRVLGIGEQINLSLGPVTFGHANLSDKLYTKALDRAATKIVAALVADLDSGGLFGK